ncbi:hypothetical protein GGR51DRAFT_495589 [Nemania sp. FL0031]|nr:hypothetical protein GGR51DRAFT_495589 [Nemania sp. FL0031]
MKACTALPWSSASISRRRCQYTYWTQILRHASTERRRNDASPIVPQTQTQTATAHPHPNVDRDHKTIATAVGDLPLSPVMDPSYWEATTRHQVPKAKEGKPQNSVERQFRKNAFAHALATPIRHCSASRTRLPSFFLQDFNLIAHPETGQPWWVPRSLAWGQSAEHQQLDETRREASEEYEELHDEKANIAMDGEDPNAQGGNPKVKIKKVQPYGPSAYVLARQDLISAFTKKGTGYENQTKRLFGPTSSSYTKFGGNAVWREDMDSLILHQMRQGIVDDLCYLSRLCIEDNRHYIVKCFGWDDVQYKHQGAVLWFGDTAQPNEATQSGPGPFSIYDISNNNISTSVAVHNMPMLLGPQATAEVRQKAAIMANASLFMLAGRRTTNLQVKLWRLQGYMADYKKENEDD